MVDGPIQEHLYIKGQFSQSEESYLLNPAISVTSLSRTST